jgi:hypothetical protein
MLGQLGVDAFAMKKILGYSTVRVSERYVHYSQEAVKAAPEKVPKQQLPATNSATLIERVTVLH